MNFDLSDIVDQSQRLQSMRHESASSIADNIPRLQRALPQIDVESRRLAHPHNNAQTTQLRHPRVLRLLSEYGFETDKIERNLQSVALRDAFEPLQPTPDVDIHSFLNSHLELSVIKAIDLTVRRAKAHSLHSLSASLDAKWDASKRDLISLNSVPVSPHRALSHHSPANPSSSVLPSPFRQPRASRASAIYPTPRPQPSSHPLFFSEVRRLVYESAPPAISPLQIATLLDDSLLSNKLHHADWSAAPKTVQHLHAIFTALRYITKEYLSPKPTAGLYGALSVAELQRVVCEGAHRYLCLQFREDKMKREIEARPIEARRGGVPGVRAEIRAYLNLIFDRGVPDQLAAGPMHDGMPMWAFVYYCLRAGYVDEAAKIVDEVALNWGSHRSVQLYRECLVAYIESGKRRMVPKHLLERMIQEYGVSIKQGEDPYERVCYIIIARVNPGGGDKVSLAESDYGFLFYSIEDYLWLRLSVARLDGDDPMPESLSAYSLSMTEIGQEVRQFGSSHFNATGDSALFYALVLILTGQFREAIGYLGDQGRGVSEAVHIGLVAYYYGMIRDKEYGDGDGADGLDSFDVDFTGLVWRYARSLCDRDARIATVYLFVVRDRTMRRELLKRLLLESAEIEMVVGRGGQGGVLSELWGRDGGDGEEGRDGWRRVVVEAGEEAEGKGERERALRLYEMGGVEEKMAEVHMKRVSAEVSSAGSRKREMVLKEAREYVYGKGAEWRRDGKDKVMESLRVVVEMGLFFDLRWEKRYEEGLEVVKGMGLLPTEDKEMVGKVGELGYGSGKWTSEVIERVPEVIVGTMECLCGVYGRRGPGGREDAGEERKGVRRWARTLVNLCGMMRNLSADMSARLVGLEVLMN